jgi:hypothetical protein
MSSKKITKKITKKQKYSTSKTHLCTPKFCAPYVDPKHTITNKKVKSCLDRKALLRLVNSWNSWNKNDKIPKHCNNTILWNAINDRMKARCGYGQEFCWMQQPEIKSVSSSIDVYKPPMPKEWYDNPDEWLNTLDIQAIMQQYERAYDQFRFIGPVPMDFDKKMGFGNCVVDELCNLNMSKLYSSGIRQIGIIFNLDPHDKPGSHWVAMHCCMNRCGIHYWDSYGMEPTTEVTHLMTRMKEHCEAMGKKMEIKINNIRHQYKNSECGVYSLHFIIQLLKGRTFESIINNVIKDDEMLEYRNVLYNKLPTVNNT